MGEHTTPHINRPTNRRRALLAAALITAIGLAGCSTDTDERGSADEAADTEAAATVVEDAGDGDDAPEEPADEAAADAGAPVSNGPGLDLGVVGRDVIVEMHVLMSSDDIERSVAAVTASAQTLGGGVASSNVSYGDPGDADDRGHAVLVVKVPPESIDRLLSGLDTTGEVRSIEQSSQDVTEQLIDLDVRIENARESVANVRGFMEQTDNLNELVTLEGELTRRQTELEQLEAQQRNLADRVALSTVTVEIVPTDTVPATDDGRDSIADAFANGWEAFGTMMFVIVYALVVLAPFLLLAAIGLAIAALVVRRRNRTGSSPEPSVQASADDDVDETVSA